MTGSGSNPYAPPFDAGHGGDPAIYIGRFRGMLMRYWFSDSCLHVELDECLTHSIRLDRTGVRLRERSTWLGGSSVLMPAVALVLILALVITQVLMRRDGDLVAMDSERTMQVLFVGLAIGLAAMAPLVYRGWRTGSLCRQRLATVGDRRYQIIIRVLDGRTADYEAFIGEVRKRIGGPPPAGDSGSRAAAR